MSLLEGLHIRAFLARGAMEECGMRLALRGSPSHQSVLQVSIRKTD